MKKVYKKLTEDQKKRGVVFSSCLSEYRTEQPDDLRHELFKINEEDFKNKPGYELKKVIDNQNRKIINLKDDKFFNSSHWNFNIIKE